MQVTRRKTYFNNCIKYAFFNVYLIIEISKKKIFDLIKEHINNALKFCMLKFKSPIKNVKF